LMFIIGGIFRWHVFLEVVSPENQKKSLSKD
jgi:hypothetical protein